MSILTRRYLEVKGDEEKLFSSLVSINIYNNISIFALCSAFNHISLLFIMSNRKIREEKQNQIDLPYQEQEMEIWI